MNITYSTCVSRRARRARIVVHPDGTVVATRPRFVSEAELARFVAAKSAWIAKHVEAQQKRQVIPGLGQYGIKHFHDHQADALALAKRLVDEANKRYGFKYNQVKVSRSKSRWGSCSPKANLSFNYKILFLPQELQQYLVVHELCHLRQMNHSPRFWALVEQTTPDYKHLRKKLRKGV